MKRASTFFLATLVIVLGFNQYALAQDDVYYDPNKDKGNQPAAPAEQPPATWEDNNNLPQEQPPVDKQDGYNNDNENPAYKYDAPQNSESYQKDGNTYITNNYYMDEEGYPYTTHLRRYYAPNYGVNFYSYWFTPSFYLGWNSWNSSYMVSINPWYSDPWWGWNRRHRAVVVYDPFYDPYWDWNFGWNSCSYYNSWHDPYWGNSCSYYGYGYNGWSRGGGGYCGGYGAYGGYGGYGGHHNGYNYGYRNGYYNGYSDGYGGGSAYNSGYYYSGPRIHKNLQENENSTSTTAGSARPSNSLNQKAFPENKASMKIRDMDIPREGIQKPFVADKNVKTSGNEEGFKSSPGHPFSSKAPDASGKPNFGNADEKMYSGRKEDRFNTIGKPVQPNENERRSGNSENSVAQPKQVEPKQQEQYFPVQKQRTDGWRDANRENNISNSAPGERPESRPKQYYRNNEQNNSAPREAPQQQWRPEQQEPRQENMNRSRPERNAEQQRMAEPKHFGSPRNNIEPGNYNPQPKQEMRNYEQPRNNFREAAPQQRSFSPSHGGGNGRGKH